MARRDESAKEVRLSIEELPIARILPGFREGFRAVVGNRGFLKRAEFVASCLYPPSEPDFSMIAVAVSTAWQRRRSLAFFPGIVLDYGATMFYNGKARPGA